MARVVVALRDKLAPKALLAWNLRDWATGDTDLTRRSAGAEVIEGVATELATYGTALGATFDLAFYDTVDPTEPRWTRELAAGQLLFLRTFREATGLRAVIGGIPPNEIGWYVRDSGLTRALNAGVLGMIAAVSGDSSVDLTTYRAAVARYAAAPARLSN